LALILRLLVSHTILSQVLTSKGIT